MIDSDRITELELEIGPDDLGLVVSTFFDEAAATIERMAGGLAAEDRVRALHFLRSGALNIGFRGLAGAAGAFESEAARDRCGDAGGIVEELRALLCRTRKAMVGRGFASHGSGCAAGDVR